MTTSATTTTKGAWLTRRARPLLAAYALVLLVVLFSPTSTVQSSLVNDLVRGLQLVLPDRLITFSRAEVAMNAVIIAPLSFLGWLAFARLRWQDWVAYGFLGATTVELLQGLLLPDRQGSFSDVVANTLGALVGAALARILFRSTGRDQ